MGNLTHRWLQSGQSFQNLGHFFTIFKKGQGRPPPLLPLVTRLGWLFFSVFTLFKTRRGRENSSNNLYLEKLLELDVILKWWILITNKPRQMSYSRTLKIIFLIIYFLEKFHGFEITVKHLHRILRKNGLNRRKEKTWI